MKSQIAIALSGLLFVATHSAVVNASDEESGPWSGNAKLGFIFTETTTSSLSVNSGASLAYDL